eukprot:2126313-Heterocapsa_arctica.AAC.1
MGNQAYKQALDKCGITQMLGEGKTGDLLECIMGKGFLYQTNKCDKMEGIMELIVYLEDLLQIG